MWFWDQKPNGESGDLVPERGGCGLWAARTGCMRELADEVRSIIGELAANTVPAGKEEHALALAATA